MGSSTQPNILSGAYAAPYTTSGAIGLGCAVGYPDADGLVAAATSGNIMGVAASAVDSGGEVYVVLNGPCYVKLAGTVTWGTTPFMAPTTAGEFIAAAANTTSSVRAIPDARNGAAGVDGDLIRAIVSVGAFHA